MKNSIFGLLFLAASATVLQADSRHILRASFPDGTGLEIFTQTTGSSQIDPQGEMGIGPGVGSQDLVNRVVVDRDNNILFAYNLEASRGASPGTVKIRIEPISARTEASILQSAGSPGRPRYSGPRLPTVAGVREFPAVALGQAVTLDILHNPSTGETIYDVLRPIAGSGSQGMSVTSVTATETISLNRITVRVNGQAIPAPASWIIGGAVRIDIPHHGTFVIAATQPQGADTEQGFAQIAQADGKNLSWVMGNDRIEITSETNVLARAGKGALWLFHDRRYQPDVVALQSADTVDWLFPKR
jgi:hypothetical protein